MPSSKMALELAKQYEFVYAALGVHPSEVEGLTEDDMAWISSHAAHEKVAAIGEIGLDYHWPEPNRHFRSSGFADRLNLQRVKLPIIVHSRDAAEPTMQIIQETKAYECGGVIHCYSYSPEMAEEYVKMGFFIGMGGVLTFKNAKKLVRCAERIPLSSIVLETDCPYMAPEPNRGKRNDSSQLIYVAQKLAEIKGITAEEVKQVTTENAHRLYRLTQNK
ncbi:MAG: TatD family hydrolase [Eubacterium sp.]